ERNEGPEFELRIASLGKKLADRVPDQHPEIIQVG
ncbi:hypothetical protein A2U01_0064516, partial [Trifolium medium]|nr:hypothetical protein [Trifolium medium]